MYQNKLVTQARSHLGCKVGHRLRVTAAAASSDGIRFIKLVLIVQRVAERGQHRTRAGRGRASRCGLSANSSQHIRPHRAADNLACWTCAGVSSSAALLRRLTCTSLAAAPAAGRAQASLAWWAVVSPFAPYGPTLSLLFVLGVAAIKAIVEDRKRHAEDRRTNNSAARVLAADGARGARCGALGTFSHLVLVAASDACLARCAVPVCVPRCAPQVQRADGGDAAHAGTATEVRWRDVAVGMVLEVRCRPGRRPLRQPRRACPPARSRLPGAQPAPPAPAGAGGPPGQR